MGKTNTNLKLLDRFLLSKTTIADATKIGYKNTFLRLLELDGNSSKSILRKSISSVLQDIDKMPTTKASKLEMLKVYSYIYTFGVGKESVKIKKELNKYFKDAAKNSNDTTREDLKEANITYDELLELLNNSTGYDYMALYLIIHFNIRNQDMIIKYTKKPNIIRDALSGKKKINIIYIDNDDNINYIRNAYKTSDRYGQNKHTFKDERFKEFLLKQKFEVNLLKNKIGLPLPITDISKFVSRLSNRLQRGLVLTQATIYKIIVDHFEAINDFNKLKEIALNRGHQLDTQQRYYSKSS